MGAMSWHAATAALLVGLTSTQAVATRDVEEPNPEELIECIKDSYEQLAQGSSRVVLDFRVITRAEGRPDVTTTGEAVILHEGDNFRLEITDSIITTPADGGADVFEGPAHERFVVVRNGDELRVLHEAPEEAPGGPTVVAFRVDAARLEPEVREKFTDPLATLRTFDLLQATAELSVQREILHGEPVDVLRTQDEGVIHHFAQAHTTFYVDPESCLVLRSEKHLEDTDTNTFVSTESDYTYETDVDVPPRAFRLRLPPDREDLTDEVAAHAQEQLLLESLLE